MTLGVLTPKQVTDAYSEIDRIHKENHEATKKKEYGAIVTRNGHRIAELQISIARSQVIAIHFLHAAFVAHDIPASTGTPP